MELIRCYKCHIKKMYGPYADERLASVQDQIALCLIYFAVMWEHSRIAC